MKSFIVVAALVLLQGTALSRGQADVPEGASIHVPLSYNQEFFAADDPVDAYPFTYSSSDNVYGPHRWGFLYSTCAGTHQSPINIKTLTCSSTSSSLLMINSDKVPTQVTIENNGYSIGWSFNYSGQRPYLTGSALNGDNYVFETMHMHWGKHLLEGSEHKLNGFGGELELHLIHRNTKYSSMADAAANADGLVVLGLLRKVLVLAGDQNIFKNMADVKEPYSSVTLTSSPSGFTLRDIIGSSTFEKVHKYPGSLTTPPCNQAVTWLVSHNIRHISPKDMGNVRAIKDRLNNVMAPNYRPVQTGTNAQGGNECFTLNVNL